MPTPPIAPADLQLPAYVRVRLGDRAHYISEHGFADDRLGLDWWNAALRAATLGEFRVSVDPADNGSRRLTREALFQLGDTANERGWDRDSTLTLLWHVLAWGSGTSRRTNLTRIKAFAGTDSTAGHHVDLLAEAAKHARARSPRAAYSTLIAPGRGKIPGLGPAFFTKFLYFAAGDNTQHGCLILDARVAANLYAAGWSALPHRAVRGRPTFSYNWYTETYSSYCDILWRWAQSVEGPAVSPDEIERALWDGPPPQ